MRYSNQHCKKIPLSELVRDSSTKDQLMLIKYETKLIGSSCKKLISGEYTVVYSESYEVPVMYFTMSDQSG